MPEHWQQGEIHAKAPGVFPSSPMSLGLYKQTTKWPMDLSARKGWKLLFHHECSMHELERIKEAIWYPSPSRPVEESIKLCPMGGGRYFQSKWAPPGKGISLALGRLIRYSTPSKDSVLFSFKGHKVVCWTRDKKTTGEKSWWTITPVIVIFADHLEVPSRTLCLATFVCFENSSFETWNTSRIRWKISGLFFSRIVICSFMTVMMLWVLSSAPCFELFSAAPEEIP